MGNVSDRQALLWRDALIDARERVAALEEALDLIARSRNTPSDAWKHFARHVLAGITVQDYAEGKRAGA